MQYKNNVLDKLVQTDTTINRLQVQLNRNTPHSEIEETMSMLKECVEEIRSVVSREPDNFEQQFKR